MKLNLQQLKTTIARNKVPLGAAGAGVVVLLALRARNKGAGPSQGVDVAGTRPGSTGYSAGYQAGPYDSSAADLYNAIQPEIEALRRRIEGQDAQTPPTPIPEQPTGYYRRAGSNSIYRFIEGKLDWIDAPEYTALGAPSFTTLPVDDTLWTSPLVGADHPTKPLR